MLVRLVLASLLLAGSMCLDLGRSLDKFLKMRNEESLRPKVSEPAIAVDCWYFSCHHFIESVPDEPEGATTTTTTIVNTTTTTPAPKTTPAPTTTPAPKRIGSGWDLGWDIRNECNGDRKAWNCCSQNEPCGFGEGDCDHDSDCRVGFMCGSNNCHEFHPNAATHADCCTELICDGRVDDGCCTLLEPCGHGGGHCQSDFHCQDGLKCGNNNCRDYNPLAPKSSNCCYDFNRPWYIPGRWD